MAIRPFAQSFNMPIWKQKNKKKWSHTSNFEQVALDWEMISEL